MQRVSSSRRSALATALFGAREAGAAVRVARLVISAILVGIGTSSILLAAAELPMGDLRIYLAAGQRLADGEPLYDAAAGPFDTWWYAPWFAWLFVPLRSVPLPALTAVWLLVLLVGTALVVIRLLQFGPTGALVAMLVGPLLVAVACGGNIQPLLVAALLHRGRHRDGPIWIGLAASLKVTPVLFALALVAERRWHAALTSVAIAAVLWLPALSLGFDPSQVGGWDQAAPSLLGAWLPAYVLLVTAASAGALLLHGRYRWLSASIAAVVALPRLFAYDVTLVASGAAQPPSASEPRRSVWANALKLSSHDKSTQPRSGTTG